MPVFLISFFADGRVLTLVLFELPQVMQNKSLILSKHGNDVEYLANALFTMVWGFWYYLVSLWLNPNIILKVTAQNLQEKLKNVPPKMSRSDFQSLILLSLASLVSYPLDSAMQQKIVKCLHQVRNNSSRISRPNCNLLLFQLGLTTTTKCAIDCMSALTLCTLDMQDVMYKLLPEVLLKLSKMSTTVHMAIPMLEFLSSNTIFPTCELF